MTHGTMNGYVNYGCRCDDCRRANTEYHYARGYDERRRARLESAGLCVLCGQQPATVGPRGGRRSCDGCRNLHRAASQRRDRSRAAA